MLMGQVMGLLKEGRGSAVGLGDPPSSPPSAERNPLPPPCTPCLPCTHSGQHPLLFLQVEPRMALWSQPMSTQTSPSTLRGPTVSIPHLSELPRPPQLADPEGPLALGPSQLAPLGAGDTPANTASAAHVKDPP